MGLKGLYLEWEVAGVPYRAPSASDMSQTHPYTRRVPMLLTDATAACSRLPCSTGVRVLSPTALHPPTLTAVSASATPRFPHSPADTSSIYAYVALNAISSWTAQTVVVNSKAPSPRLEPLTFYKWTRKL